MDKLDRPAALLIAQRYIPGASDADTLLTQYTVTRTVLGVPVPLYDPYAAALAYLMNPYTVKARSEGGVSETYIDPTTVAAWLQGESLLLRSGWPLGDSAVKPGLDLTLTFGGWT